MDKKGQGLCCSEITAELLPHYIFVMYSSIDINHVSTISKFDSDSSNDGDSFDIDYGAKSQAKQNQNIDAITTPVTTTLVLMPYHCSLQPPPSSQLRFAR